MQAMIKASKAAIMVIRGTDNLGNNARLLHTMPRSDGLALKEHTFDGKQQTNIWNCATLK